jgi:hypothetical protein
MSQRADVRIPWWHSLMYSTGILILLLGIPGTVMAVLLIANRSNPQLSMSQSFAASGVMVGAELVLALGLLAVAKWISVRTNRRR